MILAKELMQIDQTPDPNLTNHRCFQTNNIAIQSVSLTLKQFNYQTLTSKIKLKYFSFLINN
jgi:hypothetical protein